MVMVAVAFLACKVAGPMATYMLLERFWRQSYRRHRLECTNRESNMYVSLFLQPQPVRLFLSVCAFLELVSLVCVFLGFGDSMRNFLIAMGGFWPDLLKGARPIYPGQAILMFATSAILHGGPLHFFMNMLGLMWLGPIIVNRLGSNAFWLIAGLSTLGAGGLYAALAGSGGIPAVGASGVLFGFLGTVAL